MSLATSYTAVTAGTTVLVAAGSNGVALSSFKGSGVLNVQSSPSSAGYPLSGTLDVVLTGGSVGTITYTGISGNSFTGCSTAPGTSGTLATGNKAATQWSWAATANGAYDSQLTTIADNAKHLPNPWFLVWGHEPDVPASQFGSAADFIASYQHVSNLFRGICGTGMGPGNVIMAWVVSGYNGSLAASYYPGDSYCDWLGMDPYDNTLLKGSPSNAYTPMITWLNDDLMAVGGGSGSGGGHGKPLGIFETGVENSQDDGPIATWVSKVPATLSSLKTTWGSQFQLWQWWNSGNYVIKTDGTMTLTIAAMESIGAASSFSPPS
jgi:hypothetical protein